jgi:hypothetical protein
VEDYPPDIPQSFETERKAVEFARVDQTDDGTARVAFWATTKQSFLMTVRHRQITTAQKDTLLTFWAANKNLEIRYIWPATGTMYHANFTTAPAVTAHPFGRWSVDVFLVSHNVINDGNIMVAGARHAMTSQDFLWLNPVQDVFAHSVDAAGIRSFMAVDATHAITTCCVAINAHLVKDNTHAHSATSPTILERVPESAVHAHTAENCRIMQGPP